MVCDFKKIKEIINSTIESKYDHSCFLHKEDPLVEPIVANCKKVFVCEENPTAEYMARRFYNELIQSLKDNNLNTIKVSRVSVWETEHNMATYREDL
jgi:6-pyruvoyl-tetrahydropterin synthase